MQVCDICMHMLSQVQCTMGDVPNYYWGQNLRSTGDCNINLRLKQAFSRRLFLQLVQQLRVRVTLPPQGRYVSPRWSIVYEPLTLVLFPYLTNTIVYTSRGPYSPWAVLLTLESSVFHISLITKHKRTLTCLKVLRGVSRILGRGVLAIIIIVKKH